MNVYPWEVRLRPGCHGKPLAPLVSRHRSLAAAVRKARQSDRWQVEHCSSTRAVWVPPHRDDRGLYGSGPRRGEPSLAACIREAAAQAAEMGVSGTSDAARRTRRSA